MTDEMKAEFAAAGIMADSLLERFMDNEILALKFLKRFLEDKTFYELSASLEKADAERAYAASHSLKGVCANLSMESLYNLFSRQAEILRGGNVGAAAELMPQISEEYTKVITFLKRLD